MPIRISGLNSGLDTDSLVQELMSAYRKKTDKYTKSQTKVSWKQEAWKSLSAKTYSFRTSLDKIRYASAYSLKTASVSNSAKASVTADNTAVNGTQTLEITSLAKSGYLTGAKMTGAGGASVTGKTTLGSLAYGKNGSEKAASSGTVSLNGKEITLTSSMTINEVVDKFKDAGVNVSFDEANKRMFISAKESGADNDFTLTAADGNGIKALKALGIYTMSDSEYELNKQYAAYQGKDLESLLQTYNEKQNVISQASAAMTNIDRAKNYQNALNDLASIPGMDDTVKSKLRDLSGYTSAADLKNALDDLQNNHGLSLADIKKGQDAIAIADGFEKYASLEDASALGSYQSSYSCAAMKAQIESGTFSDDKSGLEADQVSAQQFLDDNKILDKHAKFYAAAGSDATIKAGTVEGLKSYVDQAVQMVDEVDNHGAGYNDGAVRVAGTDAVIKLNGAEFKSSTNNFKINGLTINAMSTTAAGEVLSINTTTDNQGIYDKIKDFLSEYNSLINSMTASFNAESAADYQPLTDDEKEAMSEKEIEKWEEKGKGGVLRRDSNLSNLMSIMTTAMAKSYTVNGKKYALSSFGIKTLGLNGAEKNEHNAYHIDGDADDETTSGNKDRLMAAIQDDPEGVSEFFRQLGSELYDNLGKMMTSTTLRSYGNFYNDKELDTEYKNYSTTISKWEDKIADMEDSYYKKFAAMEKALSELDSKSSQLAGLLGK